MQVPKVNNRLSCCGDTVNSGGSVKKQKIKQWLLAICQLQMPPLSHEPSPRAPGINRNPPKMTFWGLSKDRRGKFGGSSQG